QRQKTDTTYLANGLPSDLTTHSNASTILEHHVLGYENTGVFMNGNTVTDTFTRAAAGGSPPCVSTACAANYRYDARDRLTRTDDGHGTVTTDVLDPASNIVTETAVGTQPSSSSFTYNSGNTIASATVAGQQQLYFYDSDGNVQCVTRNDPGVTQADCTPTTSTSSGANPTVLAAYTYDYLDRLKTSKVYSSDGTTSTFVSSTRTAYDALDRPTLNDEKQGTTPTQLLFSYVGLTNAVSNETHKNGGSTTDTKTFSYDYAGGRISLTDTPSGGSAATYTYGSDANANVSLLINAAGGAKATYGYTPYGNTDTAMTKGDVSATDPLNPYRFQAKRFDPGSGTLDMGARSFSPQTGRFLQQDQYHDALGDMALATDPLTNNRYAFTGGNPVNFVEVDGHYACLDNSSSCQSPVRHDSTVSDRSVRAAATVTSNERASRTSAAIASLRQSNLPAVRTYALARGGACPAGEALISTPPAGYPGAQPGHQCQTPSSNSGWGTAAVFGGLLLTLVCVVAEPCGAGGAAAGGGALLTAEAERGGEDLAILAGEGAAVADELAVIEGHLASIDAMTGPNQMMLDRISQAQDAGRALTFGEENFLLHETTEARLVSEGLSLDAAHAAALETHPLYANYDPEVIKAFPEYFNSNWRNYWGIR
ncbi:MAG: repeat protein, partial [Aeromicrobium sp.]|nr:repeat protein [Aeromicrobium sp.]